jgi:hypothetical protein
LNYLGHFALNHNQRGLPESPYFVMGVALPDLWPRFSRRRRLHWPTVRDSRPETGPAADLQAGLLNHVAADGVFHSAAPFLQWQRAVREDLRSVGDEQTAADSPIVIDFVAHVAVELALDHHLVRRQPELAERFYAALQACDSAEVEREAGRLGAVDASGLGDEVRGFVERRFAPRYRDGDVLTDVLAYILSLTRAPSPSRTTLGRAIAAAIEVVEPDRLWPAMRGSNGPPPG